MMQSAVDCVSASEHPSNKVAATLAGVNAQGALCHISRTNYWPAPIKEKLGTDARIGNSSGTVHAETACLLELCTGTSAPLTNLEMFVTDLPCPNCVKNMAEAGVKALYIDHKGFSKDFARRRGHHFENMSLRICESAGIAARRIHRKEKRVEPILEIPEDYSAPDENPVGISPLPPIMTPEEPFASCRAHNAAGEILWMSATAHPAIGFTSETLEEAEGKYSFIIQPVNRLLMAAVRQGLKPEPGSLYSSRVPSARELVNMIGAGIRAVSIGDLASFRDKDGPAALKLLTERKVLQE